MRSFLFVWLTAIGIGLIATPVTAGPLAISPTTVEIADGRRSAVIEVKNQDTAPVDLQFRVYGWAQVNGQDRLTETDAVIVSPAIVTVAPGATQLFRVLQATPARPDREDSYRLRLNQISRSVDRGVGINLEFLLPLFSGGSTLTPQLRLADGGAGMRITNDGGRHIKIGQLELAGPGAALREVDAPRATYILPASTMALPLDGSSLPPGTRLTALGDRGPVDVAATTLVASR